MGEWGVRRLWIWGVRRVRWESKVLEWGAKSIFWGLLSKWGVKRYLRGVYRTSLYIVEKEKEQYNREKVVKFHQFVYNFVKE